MDEPKPPSFLPRGSARIIDLGLQLLILELAFRASRFLPAESLLSASDETLYYIDAGVSAGALLIYTAIAEWLSAATVGKLLTGQRVVLEDGATVTLGAALRRNLMFFIDALFLGIIAYSSMVRSPRRQRVGDHWGGTVVVWRDGAPRDWRGSAAGLLAAFVWVLASYLVAS